MKTVKELSESLKVSKVTVYNALKRHNIKSHTFKRDNITLIDETGEKLIFALFDKDNSQDSDSVLSDIKADSKDKNRGMFAILREQLKEKDEYIKALLKANEKQADKIAYLAEKLAQLTENGQILLREQNLKRLPEKTSFWDRFKRNKGGHE